MARADDPVLSAVILRGAGRCLRHVRGSPSIPRCSSPACSCWRLDGGAFRLSSRWLGPPSSLAVAILTIGAPEMAFWGRQPMLDVPSLCPLDVVRRLSLPVPRFGARSDAALQRRVPGYGGLCQIQRGDFRSPGGGSPRLRAGPARVDRPRNMAGGGSRSRVAGAPWPRYSWHSPNTISTRRPRCRR